MDGRAVEAHRERRAAEHGRRARPVLPAAERAEFAHTVPMAAEDVVGLLSTISFLRLRPDAEQVYTAVRELLASDPDTRGRDWSTSPT